MDGPRFMSGKSAIGSSGLACWEQVGASSTPLPDEDRLGKQQSSSCSTGKNSDFRLRWTDQDLLVEAAD
jgi:hypothetical protein